MSAEFDYITMAEWDWLVLPTWGVLHRGVFDDPELVNREWCGGAGETACGRRGFLQVPGLITRMGAARCKRCCRAMGYPEGIGSPKNDDACRPFVEQVLEIRRIRSRRISEVEG